MTTPSSSPGQVHPSGTPPPSPLDPAKQKQATPTSPEKQSITKPEDYDEQILKLMHTLGIEQGKTLEVNV